MLSLGKRSASGNGAFRAIARDALRLWQWCVLRPHVEATPNPRREYWRILDDLSIQTRLPYCRLLLDYSAGILSVVVSEGGLPDINFVYRRNFVKPYLKFYAAFVASISCP